MTTFNSPEIIINKKAKDFYQLVSNMDNLKSFLPDEVEDFQSSVNTCSFKITGYPKLVLEITEKIEFSSISFKAKESIVPFTMKCFISPIKEKCNAKLEIYAKLNIFTKMMIEKPLNELLEVLARKMQTI
tara:strand:- start:210 stop:599 length:390 start_codon:yes stop_codon:yes gene_type:complete